MSRSANFLDKAYTQASCNEAKWELWKEISETTLLMKRTTVYIFIYLVHFYLLPPFPESPPLSPSPPSPPTPPRPSPTPHCRAREHRIDSNLVITPTRSVQDV
ncbi:hypothetical protein V1477_006869 [Vespula maculifrons]|uniref:Uncharacterized protein n=1 Tax=Vespula maculifrons TaxID=7453 RepID=A0ABD2CGW0_VESMC